MLDRTTFFNLLKTFLVFCRFFLSVENFSINVKIKNVHNIPYIAKLHRPKEHVFKVAGLNNEKTLLKHTLKH